MSYSKLIHEYLDGGLSAEREDLLFGELAHNGELRQEFNSQVKLHAISQNDMNSISPPAASSSAIFSALGFTMPSAEYAGAAAVHNGGPSLGQKSFAALKRIMPNLFTAIFTSALTGLILFLLLDDNFDSKFSVLASDIKKEIPVSESYEKAAVVPSANEQDMSSDNLDWLKKEIASLKQQLRNNREMWNRETAYLINTPAENYETINPQEKSNITPRSEYDDFYTAGTFRGFKPDRSNDFNPGIKPSINYFPAAVNLSKTEEFNDDTKWGVELRGISSKSDPGINLNNTSSPWFSNVSLGAMYRLSKEHSIGVEGGQEKFGMSFHNTENGKEYQYMQNPMLFWYGAFYRYSATQAGLKDVLYPFAQAFAGASQAGPVGKLNIGIEYRPAKNVSLSLGLETKRLWYNIQDKTYTSDKIGVNYGITILY